jgi:hypothetical protein
MPYFIRRFIDIYADCLVRSKSCPCLVLIDPDALPPTAQRKFTREPILSDRFCVELNVTAKLAFAYRVHKRQVNNRGMIKIRRHMGGLRVEVFPSVQGRLGIVIPAPLNDVEAALQPGEPSLVEV